MARSRTKRTLNEAFSAIDQVSSGLPVSASRRHARQRETRLSAAGTTETRVSRRVSARIAACERKQEIDSASDSSDDHEYEVEDILQEKDGLFFVKWLGYGSDENTWEPEENLKLETVQRFRRRLGLPTAPLREQETCNALRIDSNEEHANQSGYESSTVDATDLVGAYVSFSPEKESWMPRGEYQAVGTTYLTGIVARIFKGKGRKKKKPTPIDDILYEVRWTTTQFQKERHFHKITRAKVLEGIASYNRLNGNELRDETWDVLCRPYREEFTGDNIWDDFEEVDEDCVRYDCHERIPEDVEEVENVAGMQFQPLGVIKGPDDLFTQDDGTTSPQLRPEFAAIFRHSASSSFLAYLPLAFWRKVVDNTNAYAASQKRPRVTLDEMMTFLGILFYMALIDKGEYANYWGEQVEDTIFNSESVRLDPVMTLKRFEFIRQNLCFRHEVSPSDLKRDPAARIRPLMNMLKVRAPKFVILGRNVAVDESSIACRSRFARHLIVFNATKPTGKYYFKIYMCCCSESWLMANFRLHCASDMNQRLHGVVPNSESRTLEEVTKRAGEVRKCVVEVTRPIHSTNRIVNTDNYYTSCQLLKMLRVFGMYGRGTIRENSKHFPRCVMISKKDDMPRGSMKQAVSTTNQIVAASWVDGSVVNIVSNSDASSTTTVHRLVGNEKRPFTAPSCVIEYNKAMQGVDRIDQLRARFSISDGHSFRKWHKKLALAFIDLARCNAFITRKLAGGCSSKRDPHRQFMVELIGELLSGAWKNTLTDTGEMHTNPIEPDLDVLRTPSANYHPVSAKTMNTEPTVRCIPRHSHLQFPTSRAKRGCVICRFEGRYSTEVTNWCSTHMVSLCSLTYPAQPTKTFVCQAPRWSCWQKYHFHYLPAGLFNSNGRIRRTSSLYLDKKSSEDEGIGSPLAVSEASTVYQ